MPEPKVHQLGIDIRTTDAKRLASRLKRLTSTHLVEDGGVYREDPSWTAIHVDTTKTEEELDDWLYRSGLDYAGVFRRTR